MMKLAIADWFEVSMMSHGVPKLVRGLMGAGCSACQCVCDPRCVPEQNMAALHARAGQRPRGGIQVFLDHRLLLQHHQLSQGTATLRGSITGRADCSVPTDLIVERLDSQPVLTMDQDKRNIRHAMRCRTYNDAVLSSSIICLQFWCWVWIDRKYTLNKLAEIVHQSGTCTAEVV